MTCSAQPPCTFKNVPLEEIKVEWGGPAVGRKALAFPGRRVICIDPAFWRSIRTVDGRAAILAHERAHIEGARCESCADRRAGEILRAEGTTTPRDAARVMAGRLENRDADAAAADLLEGYGLDDVVLPSGPGYLQHVERAVGLTSKKLAAFLATLHREGLVVDGVRYSVTVGVDGGVRTDERQAELYAQGRDASGNIVDLSKVVTYAASARSSKHGQGKAVDLFVVVNGAALLFASQSPALFERLYRALGELGESHGLVWGGRWTKLVDRPHFEDSAISSTGIAALVVVCLLVAATVALHA